MKNMALFNPDDQATYLILRQLSQANSLSVAKEQLAVDYGLSTYQINKYFTNANTDLQAISDTTPTYLDEATKGFWHANNLSTHVLQRLALLYLQRASVFLAFEYEFLYSEQLSPLQYIEQQAISRTAFYAARSQLKKILKSEDFFVASGTTTDGEYTIRLHLFELYYTTYTGVATPFTNMDTAIQPILDCCQKLIGKDLLPTQANKLRLFLKLWLLRIRNGNTLAKPIISTEHLSESVQDWLHQIQALLNVKTLVAFNESIFLYTFLVSQGYVKISNRATLKAAFPEAIGLSDNFNDRLKAQSALINDDLLDQQQLLANLDGIHLQFTTFFVEPTTFIDQDQVSFFQELYPGFDALIQNFIQSLRQEEEKPLTQHMMVNLYFSYMFALIASVPPRAMQDQVLVCVDFSEGTLYSGYVVQSLAAFSHAHIVIVNQATPTTDIYISDFKSDTVLSRQVIWQNPPTPTDWADLADMILAVKQRKTAKLLR